MSGILGVVLVATMVTGKAFNPLRGLKPLIVTRAGQPGRYWTSVVLWGALLAASAWMAFVAPTSN